MQRIIVKALILPWLRWISYIFFQKKYLQGKYFDKGLIGWKWVLKGIWFQKILGFNRKIPFPCHPNITISNYKNIIFNPDDLNNFQSPGVYWQCFKAKIYIGKGSYIAPNVGLITANHDFSDLSSHSIGKDIVLGEKCWIGMNSVILPGVKLGNNTVVAAGAVVTKSFEAGNCIIAGVPARFIKEISIS